jgi:predicted DsbA family dithiol-disulfide isomerase
MLNSTLQIDVVSDVVCPWCLIGKRQLEQALAQWQSNHPNEPTPIVRWHPFQLNPDMPAAGMNRGDYMLQKFGQRNGANIYDQVRNAATQVGLELALEKIARQPNTIRAHALIESAAPFNCQTAVKEAMMAAYFMNGADLTDDQVLIQTAVSAGLPLALAQGVINDPKALANIADQDQQARKMGISGVPLFIINRKLAVSGAQGASALVQAFNDSLNQ